MYIDHPHFIRAPQFNLNKNANHKLNSFANKLLII